MAETLAEYGRENAVKAVKAITKALARPTKPGTDLNDPKVLAGAKRIATRKNNDFKRMIDKKFSLFADELNAGYEEITPEKVIERRIESQERFKVWLKGFNDLQRSHIRKYREEVRQLVTGDQEMRFMIRLVVTMRGGDRSSRWSRALACVKKRRTEPLSEKADLVLAWLSQEERSLTHFEIWEKRGDGLTPAEILKALMELTRYAYVFTDDLVELPEKYHDLPDWKGKTAWNWRAARPE